MVGVRVRVRVGVRVRVRVRVRVGFRVRVRVNVNPNPKLTLTLTRTCAGASRASARQRLHANCSDQALQPAAQRRPISSSSRAEKRCACSLVLYRCASGTCLGLGLGSG